MTTSNSYGFYICCSIDLPLTSCYAFPCNPYNIPMQSI